MADLEATFNATGLGPDVEVGLTMAMGSPELDRLEPRVMETLLVLPGNHRPPWPPAWLLARVTYRCPLLANPVDFGPDRAR